MSRSKIIAAGLLTLAGAALATGARAGVLPLDARPIFNGDVVLNDGSGALDPTQDPIDLGGLASDNFCFPTASAAIRLGAATPDGLPDDAFFAADAYHPDLRLGWNNADDGLNARRIAAATDLFSLAVPPGSYSEIHLYFTTGDGTSDATVTLGYSDTTVTTAALFIPDWFDDPFPTPDVYLLVDGRDRVQVGSGPGIPYAYEDRDDAAIFGFRILADRARTLNAVSIERTDTTGVMNFFGGIAVEAAVPSLYESVRAPRLLDPGNVVATGVASPLDWTPPAAAVVHYFVNDGAGVPALIFVSKAPSGLRFTF
jgi:hypothetical protein